MSLAYVGVGSNLGDRRMWIEEAEGLLGREKGIEKIRSSRLYETEPVGGPPQGNYLNAVWEVTTVLRPQDFFSVLQAIELRLGRRREIKNGPRIIDLDFLFFDSLILNEPALRVPHPALHEREFVLEPLCELAPEKVHPILGRKVIELLTTITNRDGSH